MDLNAALYLVGGPLWGAVLIYALRTVRDWPGIMGKWNERHRDAAEIEGARYVRMDERMQRLEQREEECQQKLTEALFRIAKLEGFEHGQGEAMNVAQLYLSQERKQDEDDSG